LTALATAVNGAPAPTLYAWDCRGDGVGIVTSGAVNMFTCPYPTAGTVVSKVTVTGGVASGVGTAPAITVTAPPAAPTLSASLSCTPSAHTTPTVCNVATTYGGAAVLSTLVTGVTWDWGDGAGLDGTSTAPVKSHSYDNAGTYLVVVTVTATTADGAKTATTSRSVVIP